MATQRVFISYRRSDTGPVVDRMFDVLATLFGPENIFHDVDSIGTGVRFDDAIERAVERCHVLLAVIGDSWLAAESEDGGRRLDQPNDSVRREIATALTSRMTTTIPVLVHGAKIPSPGDLPEVLQQLSYINASVIDDTKFHSDLGRLCGSLRDYDPAAFARKMIPAWWDELVVPAECRDRLKLVLDDVRLRRKLREEWGIDRDRSREAMTIALWGPAGCGKTLAARSLACELGLDLYQINLEEALLRWNVGDRLPIDWLFKRTAANPILLQLRDTTGAFSSNPSGARESVLVAASLIRQLEDREGFMIVTSRSPLGHDTESCSRFDHIVELPFPDEQARHVIWRGSVPPQLPVTDGIDFDALARVPFSGASIRRVVKRAALYAARENRAVCMEHLEEAARREQAE